MIPVMRYIIFIAFLLLIGCAGLETNTGKVLDNGNSALKSSEKDVWWNAPEEEDADADLTFEERELKKSKSKAY